MKTKTTRISEVTPASIDKLLSGRKYTQAMGRRKTSTASVRIYENGIGKIFINNLDYEVYFKEATHQKVITQPFHLTKSRALVDISVKVSGGGKSGQAEGVRHGISRVLAMIFPEQRAILKSNKFLTRDSRRKERKKPGLKKARKAPQWSKR